MDFQALLIVLVLTIVSALPFVYMRMHRKSREAQVLARLNEWAHPRGASATEYEHGFDFVIGVDAGKRIALFGKTTAQGDGMAMVELDKVTGCQVVRTHRKEAGGGRDYSTLEKISLSFTARGDQGSGAEFILFSSGERVQPGTDLELAELWKAKYDQLIRKG